MTDQTKVPSATEKTLVLLAVCLAAAAMPLTFTGPAIALPALAHTLGGSPLALNWVTNAFMLTFGSGLMAAGALADSYGRKRVFLTGVAAFALISSGLAFAPGIVCFDLLRAGQGIAAAAAFSGGMAALAQEFEGSARIRAFSVVGSSFGVGLAFGPIASGLMIDALGWPSMFFLVVTLAVLAFALGVFALRESRNPVARGLDWPGSLSFTASLALLTYGILQAPENGWIDPLVLGLLGGACVLFTLFAIVEHRAARPMLDLSLFRYPRFVGAQLLAAAPAYAFVVLLVLLPVRFVGIEGMSEVEAGRMMMALSSPLLIMPVVAGLLTRWLSPATICGTGLLICAVGLFWLSTVPAGASPIAPMLLIGVGISLPWGLMDGLAVSVVPKERAGMATGIFSTTRVAGEGIALAIVSALLCALTAGQLAPIGQTGANLAAQQLVTGNLAQASATLGGTSPAMLIQSYGTAFSALLVVLAVITMLTALIVFVFLGKGTAEEEAITQAALKAPGT